MDKKDFEPFIQALQSNVWFHRQQAIQAIERLGGDIAVWILLDVLKDENENVRAQAINALVKLKSRECIYPIIKCLDDPSPKVREEACFALGILNATEAIPNLIRALEDKVPRVSYASTRALHKIGGSKIIKPMSKVLFETTDTVKIRIVEALGVIEPENEEEKKLLMTTLYKSLESPNKLLVIWSAFSLVKQGADEQIHIIIQEVDNPDKMIRFNAVTALGKLKDKRSLDALRRALDRELDIRVEELLMKVIRDIEKR
ncbi:MAG: putative lyase [bacterium ADurb.Bin363]|nr:MAG: putative lyase [bacterium ADurb.Bin363]